MQLVTTACHHTFRVYYSNQAKTSTSNGLSALNVSSKDYSNVSASQMPSEGVRPSCISVNFSQSKLPIPPAPCLQTAAEPRHHRYCDHLPCPHLITKSVNHICPPQLNPAIIATAVVYLVILALLAVLSFARSFVEAAHDATGRAQESGAHPRAVRPAVATLVVPKSFWPLRE